MQTINKELVVKLNRHWQAFELLTPKEAIVFLCSEENGEVPGYVMDYEVEIRPVTGEKVITYSVPVTWDEWIKLPVRDQDMYINTSRGKIRMPKVVITATYCDVPECKPRWSSGNVRKRDGDTCQITGRKLSHAEGNVGHDVARARGGKDTFENTAWMDKKLNTIQGTKTFAEMGWKPIRKPKAPPATKRLIRKSQAPLPDQEPFLIDG